MLKISSFRKLLNFQIIKYVNEMVNPSKVILIAFFFHILHMFSCVDDSCYLVHVKFRLNENFRETR